MPQYMLHLVGCDRRLHRCSTLSYKLDCSPYMQRTQLTYSYAVVLGCSAECLVHGHWHIYVI